MSKYTKPNSVSWKDVDTESDLHEENTNINIKNVVLDYLYNKIEVADHRYVLIKNIGDIYELKNKKYYFSGNTCGINSFLIFMKKDDNYYSYLVDRRSISYKRDALKKSSVRFTEIKLSVDPKLYEGTIFDGVLIDNDNNKIISKGENKSGNIPFMINDVFNFCGKSLLSTNWKKKMYLMELMMKEFVSVSKTNNINLYINCPYEINQSKELITQYVIPNTKKYNIKGITFYPEFSGTKLIYLFDKFDEKIKNEIISGIVVNQETKTNSEDNLTLLDTSETKKVFKFELVNPECIDDIVLNLEMKKTCISDVYKLYGIFFNSNKYIKKRIGIAYIPTYELSLKCKLFFASRNSKIMNCKFNANKGKWIPISEASVQKIDIVNSEKRLKITEEEIIEQDVMIEE